jgi:hypothetical protein
MAKKPRALSKLQYPVEPVMAAAPVEAEITPPVPVEQPSEVIAILPENIPVPTEQSADQPAVSVNKKSKKEHIKPSKKRRSSSPLNKLGDDGKTPASTIVNNTIGEREPTLEQTAPTSEPMFVTQEQPPVTPPLTKRNSFRNKKPALSDKPAEFVQELPVAEVAPAPSHANPDIDYNLYEAELEQDEFDRAVRTERAERRSLLFNRIGMTMLIVGCVYLLFLIYGALNTEYVYNDQGKLVPQVMSVEQIRAREDFEKVQSEYLQARRIYEVVLELDYRIAAGVEDPLLIAPEYEEALNMVNDLALQCQALSVSDRYTQLHAMIKSRVTNDIAIYCQNMSKAITQNNSVAAGHALEAKAAVYNDFSIITANLTKLGETVDGVNLGDITEWSPEKYINESIGGIGGEL